MTREEASFILANIDRRVCDDELNDALNIAIKVLEQEPCDKCEVGNPCLYCKHEFEPQESEGERCMMI